MDAGEACPECGGPLTETAGLPLPPEESSVPAHPYSGPGISPKDRNTVILLCYFAGIFGAHRFYLGKILTGALMLLTLGGITVWWCIDFAFSITRPYSDSKGRPVGRDYNRKMVRILIFGPIVLFFLLLAVVFVMAYVLFKSGIELKLPQM
jgi:hypothetical protein